MSDYRSLVEILYRMARRWLKPGGIWCWSSPAATCRCCSIWLLLAFIAGSAVLVGLRLNSYYKQH